VSRKTRLIFFAIGATIVGLMIWKAGPATLWAGLRSSWWVVVALIPLWATVFRALLFDPVHFVMERQMLRGLRDRAEERRGSPLFVSIAFAGFAAAAGGIAWALLRRGRWGGLLVTSAAGLLPLFTTSDTRAMLAAFVVVGLPLVAVSELRLPGWLTLPGLLGAAWLLLFVAPDAFLVIGWLLGALTLAVAVVLSWVLLEPPEADDLVPQSRSLVSHF